MAGQSSQDVLQRTVDAFAQRVNDYAQGIANRLGEPLSGTELTKDQAVQRWTFTPLGSTDQADAQYHQLVAGGMAPGQALDQVYPYRSSLLGGGATIQDRIATAQKIQGWVADASGQPVPEPPQGSTLPTLMAAQTQAKAAATPPPPALPAAATPALAALQSGPPPSPTPPLQMSLPMPS